MKFEAHLITLCLTPFWKLIINSNHTKSLKTIVYFFQTFKDSVWLEFLINLDARDTKRSVIYLALTFLLRFFLKIISFKGMPGCQVFLHLIRMKQFGRFNLKRYICYLLATLRSLINVQSLITVQGVILFYNKFKVSSSLGLFPFLRPQGFQKVQVQPSRNIVVLEQLTCL